MIGLFGFRNLFFFVFFLSGRVEEGSLRATPLSVCIDFECKETEKYIVLQIVGM